VTAIRAADADGAADTIGDPTWTPLIATPNHPSYVALHATQSYAAAYALASFFGTDRVSFTATWAGVERSFDRFSAAAHEAGISRILGGIHWSFDVAVGWHVGRDVGRYVAANVFLPAQRFARTMNTPLLSRYDQQREARAARGTRSSSAVLWDIGM
jgi:hypothetical protein